MKQPERYYNHARDYLQARGDSPNFLAAPRCSIFLAGFGTALMLVERRQYDEESRYRGEA